MMRLKKNDKVMVIAGKDKGKTGKIRKILHDKNRVIVEKLNLVKRHTRAGLDQTQGGIIEKEASIHCSNVMLYCEKCNRPVRVGVRRLKDNSKARYCRKCEELFDK